MTKNRGVQRRKNMRPGTILAKLSFSEIRIFPESIDRISGKIEEKDKGIEMIKKIIERFNLTKEDLEKAIDHMLVEEAYARRNIDPGKISWTRDERGNLASPFRTKK